MSITAKELAQELKLSAAAVSMALNGKPGVSAATRKQVIETAKRHGYDFSKLSEARPETGTICFIFYRRQGAVVGDTPFFSQLTEGVEAGCKSAGYKLRMSYLYKNENLKEQLSDIVHSHCAGIILLGTEILREDFEPFSALPVPLVLLDVYFDTIQHDCILINNVQGAFLATDYIISQTKKQPGYLHSSYSISNFEERADGFYKAVRYHGLSTSKSIVHRLTPSVEGAYADMLAILEKGEDTASCYFADNDLIAIGAIKAFQAKGKKVPDDISVIGFDNIPLASYIEPQLTTVNVPKQYMGETAAKRLIEIIKGGNTSPVKIEIFTNLVKRESVNK